MMSLEFAVYVIFLSLIGVTSQASDSFRARPQDITATVGSTVRFRCKVTELSINQAVAWMKSDRAGLATEWLTSGNDIIAPEPLANRIKIIGTSRSNLRYDLRIEDTKYSDDGLYICNILTFGEVGITTQRRSNGNILRIISNTDEPEPVSRTTAPTPWLPAVSTMYCSGIDEHRKVLVGEIITLRCIKWIHRYENKDDILNLRWKQNNRTIALERFEPNLPQTGKVVSLAGENLTVDFTFRVESFDANATFTCETDESGVYEENEVCVVGPLKVTSTSEFIMSGRSVVYVEEGDGVRLFCPRPSTGITDIRKRHLVWTQGPLLDRERYTVASDTMHIYRLNRADNELRVSCLIHSSRRTLLLGETIIRVTINGETVSIENIQEELLGTTETPSTEYAKHDIFSSPSNDQLYGSGGGYGEIQNGVSESTSKFDTTRTLTGLYTTRPFTTYKPTPPVLTTKTENNDLPGNVQVNHDKDTNLIDTFQNFNFPSDEPDWLKDDMNIHTTSSSILIQ
ncbi:hypothetical protein BSL78_11026 [Apostichopus japonicus]|uniref:Ig-like domain-containing protein n=1 Tax=Stichopus japonicus TaxID=307972 RepID=A0A2G8KVN6_STIJA|nr:hypothetical protein BSL78_11026 [Apostichopus japonicus]